MDPVPPESIWRQKVHKQLMLQKNLNVFYRFGENWPDKTGPGEEKNVWVLTGIPLRGKIVVFFLTNIFRQGLIHIFFLAGSCQEETFTPAPTLGATTGTSATRHTRQYSLWNTQKNLNLPFPRINHCPHWVSNPRPFGLRSSGVFTVCDENLVNTRGTYFVHYFLS